MYGFFKYFFEINNLGTYYDHIKYTKILNRITVFHYIKKMARFWSHKICSFCQ